MGDMADYLIEQGENMWLAHIANDCLEDCIYCENDTEAKYKCRELTRFEEDVLTELRMAGLEPYVYAVTSTQSCYVKFADDRLRTLRISDHEGKKKYSYKWNLRKDYSNPTSFKDGKVVRYVYPAKLYKDMVNHIKNYHNKIKQNS